MSDDWDDDDFEVPAIAADADDDWEDTDVNAQFEDEEDLVGEDLNAPVQVGAPSEALAAANARKAAAEEERLAIHLKETLLENETAEERKARLRREVEAADAENTADLFDGVGEPAKKSPSAANGGGAGLGGMSLKNKQDHINFAISMGKKLSKSTSFCLAAFYTELNSRLCDKLDAAALTNAISTLTTIRDEKKKKELATAAPPQKKKATKKEKALKEKKHAEMFGGGFDDVGDSYDDQYGGMEDDYMF